MAYVRAYVRGRVYSDGRIQLEFDDMKVVDGPRPKSFDEVGADEEMCRRIRERVPGEIGTWGWLGGATAMLVETSKLLLRDNLSIIEKLAARYGSMADVMYLAEVRNDGAPYIHNVAEPSGGMAERLDLAAEQMGEATELGFFLPDGWARFVLPPELSECQPFLDQEQADWWRYVNPDLPQEYEAPVWFLSVGNDLYGGRQGVISAGPAGDISLISVGRIDLPRGFWQVLDTECRPGKSEKGEPEWVPLRRKIVGIVPREGKSPMLYEFAPSGGLDPCGLHMELSGPNIDPKTGLISHLSRAILDPHGLNWLR